MGVEQYVSVVQIGGAVITAIWAVMQIKAGQVRLSDSISRLDSTIQDLREDFLDHKDTINKDLGHIRERLVVIENKHYKNGVGK